MLAVGKSNIQTLPYGAPKRPDWDSGLLYGVSTKKSSLEAVDPFSRAYMDALHKSARKKPNIHRDPIGLMQIGDFHFFNGKLARAEKAYKEAAVASADKTQSYAKLIQVLQAQHKPQEVITYYDRLAGLSADAAPYIAEKIAYSLNNMMTLGKGAVEPLLNEALRSYPDNEELINLKGIFYLITGDLQQAKREFGKVIYINSLNVHGNNNLGVVYTELGNRDKAVEYYKTAIGLDPHYITGYENIASIYTSEERFDKALKILDKAKSMSLQLTHKWDHHYGFFLLQLNKLDQATEWYKAKIKQEPDNTLLYNNLGRSYELSDQRKLALDSYEKATSIAKRKIESGELYDDRVWLAFHNLMTFYDRFGDEDSLLDTVSFVLKHNQQDSKAKYFKALINLRADDYLSAKKLLEEVLKAEPNSPEVLFNLAFIYETVEKRYDDGLALLYKMSDLVADSNNPLVQNNIAYALIKKGNLEKAESVLRTTRGYEHYQPLFATYGLYYFKTGDPAKADEYYRKAINALTGRQKLIAKQLWHTEKADYYLHEKQISNALKEANIATATLKSGYSYDDALDLKGRIISTLEKQLTRRIR